MTKLHRPRVSVDVQYAETRLRRERAAAGHAELRLGEIEGRLLDREVARRAVASCVAEIVTALGGFQIRMNLVLDAKQRATLAAELHRLRTDVAAALKNRARFGEGNGKDPEAG